MFTIVEKESNEIILQTINENDIELFFEIEDTTNYVVFFNGIKLKKMF